MVARRPAAIATIAVAAVAADAARASADALVYRCGPNVCTAAPDGTGKHRLTTDGKPGGRLYSWVSASADGSRLAVVNATYAHVLDGKGRRLAGRLPRGGIGVIAEIAPNGVQVATVDLLPEISPAPVGSPPGTPGLSGFVPYLFVMNADGSGREATARSVIDIGWLGQRLVRTDQSDADPFPYGICVLAANTDFQCGSDAARPDGKRIAFERGGDIYVAHTTGAPRERRVLKGGEQPSWTSAAACTVRLRRPAGASARELRARVRPR